ncbi:MAG: hypothetical protein H0W06_00520 [Chloroflexia bacterium]|nr:hypothetical protein [Chloroflexia bacterium]
MLNKIKELTGVYSLGFEFESFMGLALTTGFIIVVGGGIAAFIHFFL